MDMRASNSNDEPEPERHLDDIINDEGSVISAQVQSGTVCLKCGGYG